jgi:hypothetical protein
MPLGSRGVAPLTGSPAADGNEPTLDRPPLVYISIQPVLATFDLSLSIYLSRSLYLVHPISLSITSISRSLVLSPFCPCSPLLLLVLLLGVVTLILGVVHLGHPPTP